MGGKGIFFAAARPWVVLKELQCRLKLALWVPHPRRVLVFAVRVGLKIENVLALVLYE
jgi:hypothetical protein